MEYSRIAVLRVWQQYCYHIVPTVLYYCHEHNNDDNNALGMFILWVPPTYEKDAVPGCCQVPFSLTRGRRHADW